MHRREPAGLHESSVDLLVRRQDALELASHVACFQSRRFARLPRGTWHICNRGATGAPESTSGAMRLRQSLAAPSQKCRRARARVSPGPREPRSPLSHAGFLDTRHGRAVRCAAFFPTFGRTDGGAGMTKSQLVAKLADGGEIEPQAGRRARERSRRHHREEREEGRVREDPRARDLPPPQDEGAHGPQSADRRGDQDSRRARRSASPSRRRSRSRCSARSSRARRTRRTRAHA